ALPSGDYRRPQSQKNCFLRDLPANREKFHGAALLLQLALNLGDELLAAAVNVVLRVEERPAFGVALELESFDLLLALQLFLERHGRL
ncbi:MAG: hypothetical protein O7C73_06715, partial [Nitrospirae bacterium]|nr:hypothetical protein [Nitrospirota bacterium]